MDTKIIKEVVINTTQIDISDPQVNSVRKREYVEARMYYYSLCREFTPLSLDDIAKTITPRKNHATVLHGIKLLKQSLPNYGRIRDMYNNLRSRVEYIRQQSKEHDVDFESALQKLYDLEIANKELIEENKKLIDQLEDFKNKIKRQNKYLEQQGYKTNMNRTTKI